MQKIKYRKRYKYQLTESYVLSTNIQTTHKSAIVPGYIQLLPHGSLTINQKYAWDGATGAIDTKNIMRGSLVHDALYQLIRERKIDKKHRKQADKILRKICREDGMGAIRSSYIYLAVRIFGAKAINALITKHAVCGLR